MDSRVVRIGTAGHLWYDVDFPDVIAERKKYYQESETYKMLGLDIRAESGLSFLREHDMTPAERINELQGIEKVIFKRLYAGSIARKMYRLYEYRK